MEIPFDECLVNLKNVSSLSLFHQNYVLSKKRDENKLVPVRAAMKCMYVVLSDRKVKKRSNGLWMRKKRKKVSTAYTIKSTSPITKTGKSKKNNDKRMKERTNQHCQKHKTKRLWWGRTRSRKIDSKRLNCRIDTKKATTVAATINDNTLTTTTTKANKTML